MEELEEQLEVNPGDVCRVFRMAIQLMRNVRRSVDRDWDIVDEGVMTDLLAIEVRYNNDGSLTLHQEAYVRKLLEKYMPNGPGDFPDIPRG